MQLTLDGDPQAWWEEFIELLGAPRETLAPLNSAVPPSCPGEASSDTIHTPSGVTAPLGSSHLL